MNETKPATRVGAYGLIVVEGKILLCRLSDWVPDHVGKWTLPGGGIEFGEHPRSAMIREVKEETGLVVKAGSLAEVDSIRIVGPKRTFHSIRILYHASVVSGELTPETNGSTDLCQWWTLREARQLRLVDLAETGLPFAFPEVS